MRNIWLNERSTTSNNNVFAAALRLPKSCQSWDFIDQQTLPEMLKQRRLSDEHLS